MNVIRDLNNCDHCKKDLNPLRIKKIEDLKNTAHILKLYCAECYEELFIILKNSKDEKIINWLKKHAIVN